MIPCVLTCLDLPYFIQPLCWFPCLILTKKTKVKDWRTGKGRPRVLSFYVGCSCNGLISIVARTAFLLSPFWIDSGVQSGWGVVLQDFHLPQSRRAVSIANILLAETATCLAWSCWITRGTWIIICVACIFDQVCSDLSKCRQVRTVLKVYRMQIEEYMAWSKASSSSLHATTVSWLGKNKQMLPIYYNCIRISTDAICSPTLILPWWQVAAQGTNLWPLQTPLWKIRAAEFKHMQILCKPLLHACKPSSQNHICTMSTR